MADTKITALAAITTVDPAADVLPIVDISDTSMAASGTTKKITSNQILGSGGTATLASATITGDLTVDTSTLKVDSTNNRVGIRTASPAEPLTVDNSSGVTTGAIRIYAIDQSHSRLAIQNGNGQAYHLVAGNPGASNAGFALYDNTAAATRLYVDSTGVHTWQNVGGVAGTAMTLNSTGLGVGGGPTTGLLTVGAITNVSATANALTVLSQRATFSITANGATDAAGTTFNYSWANGGQGPLIFRNAAIANVMTLDASGRLLVGATSAVASGSTFENLGTARQVLTLKGNDATSYTLGLWSATTTGDNFFAYFGTEASTTVRGSVTYNRAGGLVAYNTTSDYRAKDIIGPVSNSGSLIDSLKVYLGKMHGATIERPMLVAHEAQEVAPYAVSGTKDEVDAEGKPKYQQMDASALVPLLIAEIQSLRARVQTLETR